MPKSNPEVLKAYQKKSGDAYKKHPIYRADLAKVPSGRTDTGKRQSTNIIDATDKPPRPGMNPVRTKIFKYEDGKGKQEQKARESSALDSDRIAKVSDENTRNRNIALNNLRNKDGAIFGRTMKSSKLGAPPTSFVKSKSKTATAEKPKKKKKKRT